MTNFAYLPNWQPRHEREPVYARLGGMAADPATEEAQRTLERETTARHAPAWNAEPAAGLTAGDGGLTERDGDTTAGPLRLAPTPNEPELDRQYKNAA